MLTSTTAARKDHQRWNGPASTQVIATRVYFTLQKTPAISFPRYVNCYYPLLIQMGESFNWKYLRNFSMALCERTFYVKGFFTLKSNIFFSLNKNGFVLFGHEIIHACINEVKIEFLKFVFNYINVDPFTN